MHFTAYQVKLDGSLTNRENLNFDELDGWMQDKLGKFATVRVDASNGVSKTYTDNGIGWNAIR